MSTLTDAQVERQDTVHNACHKLICDLAGQDVEWDMEHIGDLADLVEEIVCDRLQLMSKVEFHPYLEDEHFCPKCGQNWVVHDGDGSCIED